MTSETLFAIKSFSFSKYTSTKGPILSQYWPFCWHEHTHVKVFYSSSGKKASSTSCIVHLLHAKRCLLQCLDCHNNVPEQQHPESPPVISSYFGVLLPYGLTVRTLTQSNTVSRFGPRDKALIYTLTGNCVHSCTRFHLLDHGQRSILMCR